MKKLNIPFQLTEIENLTELTAEDQQLVSLSKEMADQAYAPYSEFFVGAAVLLENGKIIKGSNQENAAYPSGLCAERVAVFSASALYPGIKMKTIAISAKNRHNTMNRPISPCGACRQALLEYEFRQKEPVKLILSGQSEKIYIVNKVQDLLPLSFTADELGRL